MTAQSKTSSQNNTVHTPGRPKTIKNGKPSQMRKVKLTMAGARNRAQQMTHHKNYLSQYAVKSSVYQAHQMAPRRPASKTLITSKSSRS